MIKIFQLVGFGFGGLAVALITNIILLRFSESLGIRNKNDVIIRWSNQSKPSLGGVSFYMAFVFAAIAYSMIFSDDPNIFQNAKYIGLFSAGSLAFIMGLADDAYNTKPLIKLSIQIICGLLFAATGTVIHLFGNYWLDLVLTVVWVVVIMNSLNMLDNMDGITGTTVFFILAACLASNWLIFGFNANIWSILMITLIGAMIGFLSMNIHPSKLFMGDAGSQFIGAFVAFFGVEYLWNIGDVLQSPSWLGICVTLVAFTPAAVDTLTVVINRLRKGKSPMVGGKDHTTHHLVYAGLNDFQVWLTFVLIGFISFVLATAMVNLIRLKSFVPVLFFVLFFIVIFFFLYRNTIKYPEPKS